MASRLRDTLELLHKTIESRQPSEAILLLSDVGSSLELCQRSEIGFLYTLIFSGHYSILNLLKKLVLQNEFTKCQDHCLSLIQVMVPLLAENSCSYTKEIFDTCFHVLRSARSSVVKEKTVEVIIALIETHDTKHHQIDIDGVRKLCIEELAKRSGTSSSAKCCCFHLLGLLTQSYPEKMTDHIERLLQIYLRELKREFRGTSDLKVIEGCLKGLSCLLTHFSEIIDDQPDGWSEIFKYTITSIQPKSDLSRYAVPAAGLQLLQRHASKFRRLLIDQCESVYAALQKWFNHKNPQMKHEAHLAIVTLLREVAVAVSDDTSSGRARDLFMCFTTKFRETLEARNASNKAVSLAIQGFGLFARLCGSYMPPDYVQKMLSIMMDKCTAIYLGGSQLDLDPGDIQLHLMPNFLFSLGNIVREVIKSQQKLLVKDDGPFQSFIITDGFRRSLCHLSLHLMKGYPQLNKKFSKSCCTSLVSLMAAFSSCPDHQRMLLSEIVYLGLIRCCSAEVLQGRDETGSTSLDAAKLSDIDKDTRTYTHKDYLDLWTGLICSQNSEFLSPVCTASDASDYLSTQRLIFSEVLASIAKVVSKLNLSLKTLTDIDIADLDKEDDSEAESENIDLKIFNHVFDLCAKLLPAVVIPEEGRAITGHLFLTCVHQIIKALIKGSTCYPNVASFFELLTAIMGICVKVDYFNHSLESSTMLSMEPSNITERDCCRLLVRKFAQEVTSSMVMRRDDVLTSSLFFVLSLPEEVAKDMLNILVQPLQMGFRLGLGCAPLAEVSMNAMLRWTDAAKSSMPESFLSILPDLEPFLHRIASKAESVHGATMISRTKRGLRIPKLTLPSSHGSSLKNMHTNVTRFLGSIGGMVHYCVEVIKRRGDSLPDETKQSRTTDALWYSIPFQELKVDLQLNSFLPRITELAVKSVNRQARVTACELLHSLTIYIIGKSAHQDEAMQQQHPMTRTYGHIAPVILRLACDIEPICKQLFAPLVMQLIHWFTRNRRYENPDMVVFLNSIMDGLVDEVDSTLRDFCAITAKEFLVWSIKQDVDSENSGRKNAKSLFKRLHSLARHPSAVKRLGSAMAFNQMYSVFRENELLVDEFTFEFLVAHIDSLSMAQDDDDITGTRKASKEALRHIKRIVTVKYKLLNMESKIRRRPSGFLQNDIVTLSTVVLWLLNQCGRSQSECRHVCMELLHVFIPLLPGNQSLGLWMKEFIDYNGIRKLTSIFEGGAGKIGIALYPLITFNSMDNRITALCWLDLVLTSLDCYTWVVDQRLLSPSEIFENVPSNFFKTIEHLLRDVVHYGMKEILSDSDVYTPSDYDKFNKKKCTVIVRILQFTNLMLRLFPEQCLKVFPSSIWEPQILPGVVAVCLVDPSFLGFNANVDLEIAEKLPVLMDETVGLMVRKFPEESRNKFVALFRTELMKNGTLLNQLSDLDELGDNMMKLAHLLSAYNILAKNKVFDVELPENEANEDCPRTEDLLRHAFNSVVKRGHSNHLTLKLSTQRSVELMNKLLNLAFTLGVAEDSLLHCITNNAVVHDDAGTELSTRHGQLFFVTYKASLCREMCSKSSTYIPLLSLRSCGSEKIFITNELLEYLFAQRKLRQEFSSIVCRNILEKWHAIQGLVQRSDADTENMSLALFCKVVTMESKVCSDPDHPLYHVTFELFKAFLTSPAISLRHKLQVLPVTSLFASAAEEKRQDDLKSVLYELSSMHFPIRSAELMPGTNAYEDYISALRKLLFSLELTGNKAILEVLISSFCAEDQHSLGEEFQTVLERCLLSATEERQKALLDVPYKIFEDGLSNHNTTVKCRILDFVLMPLLAHCALNVVREFFISHIGEITKSLMEDHKKDTVNEWRDQLAVKSCCYRLMEKMFSRLPGDLFKIESSPLVQSFASSPAGAGSTKFLKTFLGKAVRDKNEDISGDSELLEERRLFHCAVYNAVISAVVCTQTEVKWFDVFVFSDNPRKKEFLFDNIIDKKRIYAFPVETEENQRKKIISVRSAFRDTAKASNAEFESVVYASSQVGSSLSEDADRFDSNTINSILKGRRQLEFDDTNAEDFFVEVESDCVNNHECMQNLVRSITHMRMKKIGFPEEDDDSQNGNQNSIADSLPKWLNTLIQKLDSSPHLNVKIFITKLIINCKSSLWKFATHLLPSMIRTLLAYMKNRENTEAIDQFVVDVMVTLLSWSPFSIPKNDTEEKILARAIIESLMRTVKHTNLAITRRNLDLIKTAIECWRERVDEVNTDIMFSLCSCSDPKSTENFAGLCLLEVLLANGLPPYSFSVEVDRNVYFQRIFRNILSSRKAIVDMASQVMGMALKNLYLVQSGTDEEIQLLAQEVLKKLSSTLKAGVSGLGVFMSSLHKVACHYPPIAEPFVEQVLFNMPRLPGAEIKICCVDILRLCISKIDNPIVELKAKGFLSMMAHRDDGLQYSCLKLSGTLLRKTLTLDTSKGLSDHSVMQYFQECVDFLLPTVELHFPHHPSNLCRQELYGLAMQIYDVQTGLLSQQHSSPDTLKTVKRILLCGLVDGEESLRLQVVNFLSEDGGKRKIRVSVDPSERAMEMLKDWYQPEVDEVEFLRSFCNLLMQTTSRSPDFRRPIFDNPLSECNFQEYCFKLCSDSDFPLVLVQDLIFGGDGTSVRPTLSTAVLSSVSVKPEPTEHAVGATGRPRMLKATQQDLQFSATMATHDKSTYNWMTGESVDTFSDLSDKEHIKYRHAEGAGSSRILQSRKRIVEKKKIDSDFGRKFQKDDENVAQVLNLDRLRRRFHKDSSADHHRFARIAVERQKRQTALKASNMGLKNAVQMYRSYRIGDLPDIQIPHCGLLSPMTALAQNDHLFLQRFMTSVIHGVLQKLNTDDNLKYCEEIATAFTRVLKSSQQCDSTFIGCILDIVHRNVARFNISPLILSKAAVKANQQGLGIRAIEEWLVYHQEEGKEPNSKRRKLTTQPCARSHTEILAWVALARLYNKDLDTLQGIFAESPIARPLFSKAAGYEVYGDYGQAQKVYQEALVAKMEPEASNVEKDLWEDCLINCLAKLGRWQDVNDFCDHKTEKFPESIWTDEHFQQRFLSTSLHAKVLLLLQGDTSLEGELMSFFKSAAAQGEKGKIMLETEYPDHAAMLHIYLKNYESARHYLNKATDAFADGWSRMDNLSSTERHASLSKLLHLSDMMDFLELMDQNEGTLVKAQKVNELLERWPNRTPHPTYDSFTVWEDMLAYRGFFLDQLSRCTISEMAIDGKDDQCDDGLSMRKLLAEQHLDLILKAADEACKRKYFALSRKLLNEDAQNITNRLGVLEGKDTASLNGSLRLCLCMSSYYLTFANHQMNGSGGSNISTATKAILESYDVLNEALEKDHFKEKIASRLKLYSLLGRTFELAVDVSYATERGLQADFGKMISSEHETSGDPKASLMRKGQSYLCEGITLCPGDSASDGDVADLYLTYALYCDKMLQNNDFGQDLPYCESLSKAVVKFVLRTMNYRNDAVGMKASLKYPRLLQLIEMYPGDAKTCFLEETAKMPMWIFLRWISQMVALLDKPEADAIHGIIRDLAAAYPQAAIYPLKTSYPAFAFGRDEVGRRNKTFVSRLHSELDEQIPVVQLFIRNLTLLTNPSHIFKEWFEDAVEILRRKDRTGLNKLVLTKYQNMYNQLFATNKPIVRRDSDENELDGNAEITTAGSYWINFSKAFHATVDKAFGGPTGGQVLLMEEKRFSPICQRISKDMNNYCNTHKPQTLKEYSRWLFDFHYLKLDHQEIEIPGQYKGTWKPRPEFHIKIASFEDVVLVMPSLQQPKRITIKASDCKDHQFLVKGNEDLRQDQRIQQLFDAMNITFQQESSCAKRSLHINTYQVVPVTARLGLIEWVNETKTLRDIVYNEAKHINKSACLDEAANSYRKWLSPRYGTDPRRLDTYGNMVTSANYTEVCRKYSDIVSLVPRALLRNAYLKLSSSPEHFLTLRKAFMSSYGPMCIAHWILGIGDRHAQNCMISLKTGEAVGIDFGHAFGTATEVLPVPEIVPFRLTPQLCYLMSPHPAKHGRLRQSMLSSLSALQSNRDTILAMLDVFLKEPSIDWLKHANKLRKARGPIISYMDSTDKLSPESSASPGSTNVAQWYPLRKIDLVKRKLTGSHPVYITRDELRHNLPISKKYLPHYEAVATGVKGKCLRTSKDFLGKINVNDQVDFLIDQASDPNVIGRSYVGWCFWI